MNLVQTEALERLVFWFYALGVILLGVIFAIVYKEIRLARRDRNGNGQIDEGE